MYGAHGAGHLGGLATGLFLGYSMAPKWDVVREVDIPLGAMQVPDQAEEVEVVVDRQPRALRITAAASCAASLLLLISFGVAERGAGG